MENTRAFQERNIVGICEYMSNYCTTNINSSTSLSSYSALPFYNFFPVLLVYIFGSPNTRGWIQTETQPVQDQAIESLLSVNGPFIHALKKLSVYPEYTYDLVTDSLPADIQRVLSSGAVHLLPRVYANCTNTNASSVSNSIDLRAAATRQSTLLPNGIGGERIIRLNMIQLYIFYLLSVPTWEPLKPPPAPPTTAGTYTNGPNTVGTSTPYGTGSVPSGVNNPSTNPGSSLQYQIAGNLRSINLSIYPTILEQYFAYFIPINSSEAFPKQVGTFFLDACVELWIRTRWVATGQKLSTEYMQCITAFVKYIVRQDLRKFTPKSNLVMTETYKAVKDELYMLISRLALNWSRDNDYLSVVDLWAIWAAPWKLGQQPSSSGNATYTPIAQGWASVIVDNIPFYVLLVDILLQRASTFAYKDTEIQQPQAPLSAQPMGLMGMTPTTSTHLYGTVEDVSNVRGNLRVLYRIINVLKGEDVVDFLGHIERGLGHIKSNAPAMHELATGPAASKSLDLYKYLSNVCYNTERMDTVIKDKLISAYELLVQINDDVWKTRGLYSDEYGSRSIELIKTINGIRGAIVSRKNIGTERAKVQATQLREAYDLMRTVFKIKESNDSALQPNDQVNRNQPQSSQQQRELKLAGSSTDGFLTPEEIQAVYKGRMLCTVDNVQPLGARAKTIVRTYEYAWLVHWILKADPMLNYYYNSYLPLDQRPAFFPSELTLRPWASRWCFWVTALIATVVLFFSSRVTIKFLTTHLFLTTSVIILITCFKFRNKIIAFYHKYQTNT